MDGENPAPGNTAAVCTWQLFYQIRIDLYICASMMAKHGTKAVKDFTSNVYKEYGMRIVVLAAYVDTEGEHAMSLWV